MPPRSGRPSGAGWAEWARFHTRITEFSPAAAIMVPRWVKATVCMTPGGPRIRVTSGPE